MTRIGENSGGLNFEGHKAQPQQQRLGININVSGVGGTSSSKPLDFKASAQIPAKSQQEAAKAIRWGRIL